MPTESATYYWLSCSAKIDNLMQPRCTAVSEGVFDDADTMRKRALVAGWTSPTKTTDLCPAHSSGIRLPSEPRPARRPRADTPAQVEQVILDADQH